MNNSERNVILFFGNSNSFSTAKHRSDALKRLGFKVILHDPYLQLKSKLTLKYISYFNYITGYFYLQKYMLFWINDILKKECPSEENERISKFIVSIYPLSSNFINKALEKNIQCIQLEDLF